ncbi:uncharacterized protein Z518_08896 [Rhinocladiella mackenziei CBS 650.93]|uniref:BZIP domain-containing protein n=1 Tax=Rhinocladiella mackenziei CBS 650.93 TaxID=1442369 RepID=A0A0D2ID63_9EURO|nr:uncharacterized protein Z518_08896 [Rhinocladiella mackenziei CBS 650.93]KIX01171.1 hypothetical protein Z518_08896 [Rhinocladiella mackenziei CBS 650.93]
MPRLARVTKSATGADDPKRLANRLAQRKFREQRKNYISLLERELALCHSGASNELLRRRRECERLEKERDELLGLLHTVAEVLRRYTRPWEPSEVEGDSTIDQGVPEEGSQDSSPPNNLRAFVNVANNHDPSNIDIADTAATTLYPETNGATWMSSIPRNGSVGMDGCDIQPQSTSGVFPNVLHPDSPAHYQLPGIQNSPIELDPFSSQPQPNHPGRSNGNWSADQFFPSFAKTSQPLLFDSIETADNTEPVVTSSQWGMAGPEANPPPRRVAENHYSLGPHGKAWVTPPPMPTGFSLADSANGQPIPGSLSIFSGLLNRRKPWAERVDLLFLLLQRSITQFLTEYNIPVKLKTFTLQNIDREVCDGITKIVSRTIRDAFCAMNFTGFAMIGGSAWVVWQLVKNTLVFPCLKDFDGSRHLSDKDGLLELLRDTLPDWLKPTDLQLAIEHQPSINFVPWPDVRNRLILNQDRVLLDEFFCEVTRRFIPSGAEEDRLMFDCRSLPDIGHQFYNEPERTFRSCLYGNLDMWKVRRASESLATDSSIMVDELLGCHVVD